MTIRQSYYSGAIFESVGTVHVDSTIFSGNMLSDTSSSGNGNANALRATNAALYVKGCLFQGNGFLSTSNGSGRAVYCTGNLFLTDSNFIGNAAYYGGAVYYVPVATGNSMVIDGCRFFFNRSSYGGAVYAPGYYNKYSLVIKNSIFKYNNGANGGAMYLNSGGSYGTATLNNCIIEGNRALYGGGLYASTGTFDIEGSRFTANSADEGGGLYGSYNSSMTIKNSIFNDNQAVSRYGGGVYNVANSGTCSITSSRFVNNTAVNHGAALSSFLMTTIDGCLIAKNKGETAVSLQKGSISNSTLVDNVPPDNASSDTDTAIVYSNNTLTLSKNTLYGSQKYYVYSDTSNAFQAASNYWGTTSTATIRNRIYDFYDDPNKGEVYIDPILTAKSATSPAIPSYVTVTAGEGGIVDPAGTVPVAPGASQAFALTPFTGYAVRAVTLDGVAKGTATPCLVTGKSQAQQLAVAFSNPSFNDFEVSPSPFAWKMSGSGQWSSTTKDARSPAHSFASPLPVLGYGQTSTVSLDWKNPEDGMASFFLNSGSGNYYVRFYVNSKLMLSYALNEQSWQGYAVYVPAGTNTLAWQVERDDSYGSPYAQIDDIMLPSLTVAPVHTGGFNLIPLYDLLLLGQKK